jgi:hypothetical protein
MSLEMTRLKRLAVDQLKSLTLHLAFKKVRSLVISNPDLKDKTIEK